MGPYPSLPNCILTDSGGGAAIIFSCVPTDVPNSFQWLTTNPRANKQPWLNSVGQKVKHLMERNAREESSTVNLLVSAGVVILG